MAWCYLTCLIIASFLLNANSSAILDLFSNTESRQEDADDAFVPEVYGGALTEFFETVSVVGEGEVEEEDILEDHDEKIPERNIAVEEFLLITDHELKARPISDLVEEKMKIKQLNVSQMNLTTESGASSVPYNISTSLPVRPHTLPDSSTSIDPALPSLDYQTNVPLDGDGAMRAPLGRSVSPFSKKLLNTEPIALRAMEAPIGRSFSPLMPNTEPDALQFIQPLKYVKPIPIDLFTPPTESSNAVSSLSTSKPVNARTESTLPDSTVDNINTLTTSFDALLLELNKLEDLSEAVADLHINEAQSETGDKDVKEDSNNALSVQLNEAQDRTDPVDENEEDKDNETFDLFAELYKWLG